MTQQYSDTPTMPGLVPEFRAFPKIPRFHRPIIITEKIDGTNAQVFVSDVGEVFAGSRNRWITPEYDNFGFAAWVRDHADELRDGLGPGHHYGEWFGAGIQRGYGYKNRERHFALFNVARWGEPEQRPSCCTAVPVLATADVFDIQKISLAAAALKLHGSKVSASEDEYQPAEGIMIYHSAAGQYFKHPFDDGNPKGQQ